MRAMSTARIVTARPEASRAGIGTRRDGGRPQGDGPQRVVDDERLARGPVDADRPLWCPDRHAIGTVDVQLPPGERARVSADRRDDPEHAIRMDNVALLKSG